MITIVSGFMRSGTSLMMQMLHAGGMPCYYDGSMGYPSFENRAQQDQTGEAAISWLYWCDSQALKWLDPLHWPPPERMPHETRVLWMRRDAKQQAYSAQKFMTRVGGLDVPHKTRRRLESMYRRESTRSIDVWRRRATVLAVRFESVLADPTGQAAMVAGFLSMGSGLRLDPQVMASQVRRRGPECLPGFLEEQLMDEHSSRIVAPTLAEIVRVGRLGQEA